MKNPLPDLRSTAAGLRIPRLRAFNLFADHDHGRAATVPMMVGMMMSAVVMGDREIHNCFQREFLL